MAKTTVADVLNSVEKAAPKKERVAARKARKILKPSELPRNEVLHVAAADIDGVDKQMTMALVQHKEPSFYKVPGWGSFWLDNWVEMPNFQALLLAGARGTGKTLFAQVMSARTGRPLLTVNCNPDWTAWDLLATQRLNLKEKGGDYLIPGPIRIAAETGALVLFDEYTLLGPGTQAGMNSAIDETQTSVFCALSGERVHWKEEPKLMFAVNEGYAGTREVQEAFRDRCLTLVADYLDPADEVAMLVERTKCERDDAKNAVQCASAIREASRTASADKVPIKFDMSPRALLQYCALVAVGRDPSEAWQEAVINRAGYSAASRYVREKLVTISKSRGFTGLRVY